MKKVQILINVGKEQEEEEGEAGVRERSEIKWENIYSNI